MAKPKGGRGNIAPYDTKLVRVPVPLAEQVSELVERYQEWIAEGGDPFNPPPLLDSIPFDKPVNELSDQQREDETPQLVVEEQPEELVNNFIQVDIPVNRLSELENELASCQASEDKLRSQLAALSSERDRLSYQLNDQATRAGEWYEKAKEAQRERDELVELNHALTIELSRVKTQGSQEQLPDLEAVRDRVLAGLKLGKQAPGYKAAVKVLDRFVAELRSQTPTQPAPKTQPAEEAPQKSWDSRVDSFLAEVTP